MILISFGDELCYGNGSPKMIADENGFEFVDRATSTPTSNLSIYKDVIHTTIDIDDPEKYIFLIGWTSSNNIKYKYKDEEIIFTKEKYNNKIKQYDKLNKFNRYLFEPVLISQQRLALVHHVQQTLESRNFKYYMYNTCDKIDYSNHTSKSLKHINNRTYHNALSFDSTMIGYIKKQKLDYDNGQKAWAKFLSQKMRAAGVIQR